MATSMMYITDWSLTLFTCNTTILHMTNVDITFAKLFTRCKGQKKLYLFFFFFYKLLFSFQKVFIWLRLLSSCSMQSLLHKILPLVWLHVFHLLHNSILNILTKQRNNYQKKWFYILFILAIMCSFLYFLNSTISLWVLKGNLWFSCHFIPAITWPFTLRDLRISLYNFWGTEQPLSNSGKRKYWFWSSVE